MRAALPIALAAAAALAAPLPALGAADPLRARQWGLDMIEADAAHRVATGTGAIVAVIDSGVQADHPDLTGRLLPGRDFVDDDATPQDGDGHGTHVTGIVAATEGNGIGIGSVAPGAKVLPLRVLDDYGAGDLRDVADAIDYAVAHGADVINLSLGEDVPVNALGFDSVLDPAFDRALDRGVVIVAAAGNTGLPICEQPSGEGRILCVGAVDRRGVRSFYSSFGSGLGLVAPGGSGLPAEDEDVLSTYRGGTYRELAGTSQATPHVSGVAALLVSVGVRGQDAVRRILATAKDAGVPGPDSEYGAGIVNARAALAGLRGAGGGGGPTGGGGPSGSGPSGSAARVRMARVQRAAYVLRRGILVRCTAAGAGRCVVRASVGGRRIASGSRLLRAGRATTVRAALNRRGRALVRRARRVRVRVVVRLPGARAQVRTLMIRR